MVTGTHINTYSARCLVVLLTLYTEDIPLFIINHSHNVTRSGLRTALSNTQQTNRKLTSCLSVLTRAYGNHSLKARQHKRRSNL